MKITSGIEDELQEMVDEVDAANRDRLIKSPVHEVRKRAEKIYEQVDYQKSTKTVDNRTRELRDEIRLLINCLDTF